MQDKPVEKWKKDEFISFFNEFKGEMDATKARMAEVTEGKSQIEQLKNELQRFEEEIRTFHRKLFEGLDGEKSIREGIENLENENRGKVDAFLGETRKHFEEHDQKTEELHQRTEALLPGAATAGLASSFHQAKKEELKTRWSLWFGFLGSLIFLSSLYFYSFVLSEIELTWFEIAIRISVGFPFVWLAWFCQKNISENKRIAEEYHYKQRIMSFYDGFSRHIKEQLKDEKLVNKLNEVVLSGIAINPAQAIDKKRGNHRNLKEGNPTE